MNRDKNWEIVYELEFFGIYSKLIDFINGENENKV